MSRKSKALWYTVAIATIVAGVFFAIVSTLLNDNGNDATMRTIIPYFVAIISLGGVASLVSVYKLPRWGKLIGIGGAVVALLSIGAMVFLHSWSQYPQ